jgi:carboxylate-amine ligase
MPPDFPDWDAFERFLQTSIRAGMFESVHDIHWDIRPRPHLGTVEVRIMDAQSSVTEAVALASFIRALAAFLRATRANEEGAESCCSLPWWAQKDNCFNASCRY